MGQSLILLLFIFRLVSYADTNGIFIQARDVVPGTFGADEGGSDFTFPSNLNVLNEINTKILNVSDSLKYEGVELDDRYVDENQKDSISSNMIINNVITSEDIKNGTITIEDLSTESLDSRYLQPTYNPSSLEENIEDLEERIEVLELNMDSQRDDRTYLFGAEHTLSQCENKGGTVVKNTGEEGKNYDGTDFCKFSMSSCPSGWSKIERKQTSYWSGELTYNWIEVKSNHCKGEVFNNCPSDLSTWLVFSGRLGIECNSPSFQFKEASNTQQRCIHMKYIRKYRGSCALYPYQTTSCYSTITKIGCY